MNDKYIVNNNVMKNEKLMLLKNEKLKYNEFREDVSHPSICNNVMLLNEKL